MWLRPRPGLEEIHQVRFARLKLGWGETPPKQFRPAAPPHGSLTPADAPLIDAEKLFRQPGPAQDAKPATAQLLGEAVEGSIS
jgi:hypothetical protein